MAATGRDPRAREKEKQVIAFLALEASKSNGSYYRLVLGVKIPPRVASVIMLLARLF
jgi:hypothetical protein